MEKALNECTPSILQQLRLHTKFMQSERQTHKERQREKEWGSMNENLIWQKTQLNLRAQSKNKASGNNSVYADDAQQDKRNLWPDSCSQDYTDFFLPWGRLCGLYSSHLIGFAAGVKLKAKQECEAEEMKKKEN